MGKTLNIRPISRVGFPCGKGRARRWMRLPRRCALRNDRQEMPPNGHSSFLIPHSSLTQCVFLRPRGFCGLMFPRETARRLNDYVNHCDHRGGGGRHDGGADRRGGSGKPRAALRAAGARRTEAPEHRQRPLQSDESARRARALSRRDGGLRAASRRRSPGSANTDF